MAKIGRPRIIIDWSKVDALCQIQCTGPEIASVLGISEDTFTRHCKEEHDVSFAEYIKGKSEGGKASLRRKQWKLADKSAAMAIFLGKNYLEQKDRQDVEYSGKDGGPIKWTIEIVNAPKLPD